MKERYGAVVTGGGRFARLISARQVASCIATGGSQVVRPGSTWEVVSHVTTCFNGTGIVNDTSMFSQSSSRCDFVRCTHIDTNDTPGL